MSTTIIRRLILASAALALTAATLPAHANRPGHAKNKGTPPGLDKKPSNMPPGQYKKLRNPRRIDDLSRYRLPKPGRGEAYVVEDDRIYRVVAETMTVVAAMGIVADWLN